MKLPIKYFLFAFLLIVIDQALKLWMYYVVVPEYNGSIDLITGVFKLHYVTNPGMAFGMELGGDYGKIALTLFRVAAMFLIGYYLYQQSIQHPKNPILWALAAILAGAIGNLIDSIFYAVWLPENATQWAATPWFHGEVIDMFYFNWLDGFWPDWVPRVGGTYFHTPIFNFADACIFCGVVAILIFQKKFLELGNDNPIKDNVDKTV
jgi:signal peptidase II